MRLILATGRGVCILVPVGWFCAEHQQLGEELGGCGGLAQEQRPLEKQRLGEGELSPQRKSTDPVSAGLVLDPALGDSSRTLKLTIITEKLSSVIKVTPKRVLYLGKTKTWR